MEPVRVDSMPKPVLEPEEEPTADAPTASQEPEEAAVATPSVDTKSLSTVDIKSLLNRLDRELRMVEGLTPMRKSIEKKKSLEVAKLDTDAAIRK
jgi:hypothetical protein